MDPEIYQEYRAVVLAGGGSRRMGEDKSGVTLRGKPLLVWVEQALESTGIEWSVLRHDLIPGLGPLGGVLTAFHQDAEKPILFLSCDMPFLNRALLYSLVEASNEAKSSAFSVVSERIGFPFLVLPDQAAVVSDRLDAGRRSLSGLGKAIPSAFVAPKERDVWRFHNINSPHDLEMAKAYLNRLETDDFREFPECVE